MTGIILCALALASCAKNTNSSTYTEGAGGGKVLEGTVIRARAVTLKSGDNNMTGALAGGATGLAAGSAIGNDSGNIPAEIGGALIGAVTGAYIENALSTHEGTEYLVKLDKKYIQEYDQTTRKIQAKAGSSVEQDMTNTINVGTKTDIISVAQATDPDIKVGSHVYIIYTSNQAHLAAETH